MTMAKAGREELISMRSRTIPTVAIRVSAERVLCRLAFLFIYLIHRYTISRLWLVSLRFVSELTTVNKMLVVGAGTYSPGLGCSFLLSSLKVDDVQYGFLLN